MTTEQHVPTGPEVLALLGKVSENWPTIDYVFDLDVRTWLQEVITTSLVSLERDIPSDSAFEGVFMAMMMGFEAGRDFERTLAFNAAFPIQEL